jgi:hypothetical protein
LFNVDVMDIDVVQLVKDGKGRFEWMELLSEHGGNKLFISVLRDAMKFDGIPALTWNFQPVLKIDPWYTEELFDGVRLPASALQLQQIADLIGAMLLTPKIIDLIWLQAGLKFDCITQTQRYPDEDISDDNGVIAATSHIHVLHQRIEAKIAELGGDDGTKLVSCVGKYWCLIQQLANVNALRFKSATACNYGWFAEKASGPGLSPGTQCWQRPGYQHDHHHWDPSQTIRLMYHLGRLVRADGSEESVDLRDIAQDKDLCPLITHDGKPLTYLRQAGVPQEEPLPTHGVITLPEITIIGRLPKDDGPVV